MNDRSVKTCDECESLYFPETSIVDALCPECSHLLYGYESCPRSSRFILKTAWSFTFQ